MTLATELDQLKQMLESRTRVRLGAENSIRCAVLLGIIPDDDDHRVLYTLRSQTLPSHRGQVAFPGGKFSDSDSGLLHTALRESTEEVGIHAGDVTVLGALDDVYTLATRFRITPYVGVLPRGVRFTPNPDEVADIFTVGIGQLADRTQHGVTTKRFGDSDIELPAIHAGPHEIWGATHKITLDFLACMEQLGAH